MSALSINRSLVYLALALLAFLAYAVLFFIWRIDVPYQDDFNDILRFLLRYQGAANFEERITLILEPQGNHRTGASRLVYLLVLHVQGTVDFVSLSVLSNFALPILCLIYSFLLFRGQQPVLALALAALIVFSPRAFTLLHWPMTAFHFYFLLLYGAMAIVLLQYRAPLAFIGAALAATAASFTSAGGQAVWIIGALYLVYLGATTSRGYFAAVLWVLTGLLMATTLYVRSSVDSPFPAVEEAGLLHFTHFVLVLLGSAGSYGSAALSAGLGFGLCCLFLAIVLRDLRFGLHAGHFYTLLLFALAAAISWGRSRYFHAEYALTARYSFVSLHLVACLLLLWLSRRPIISRPLLVALLVSALLFCIGSYRFYGPQYERLMNRRVEVHNAQRYGVPFRSDAEMQSWVDAAVQAGIYKPPGRPLARHYFFTRGQGD